MDRPSQRPPFSLQNDANILSSDEQTLQQQLNDAVMNGGCSIYFASQRPQRTRLPIFQDREVLYKSIGQPGLYKVCLLIDHHGFVLFLLRVPVHASKLVLERWSGV